MLTSFTRSIRGRLLLWLAFMLVCILSGFGVTAYRLHRNNQLQQIDEGLERRVAALSADMRGRGLGPPPGRGPIPGEPERERPLQRRLREGGPGGPREIRVSPRTQNLFDEGDTNSFYFAIWSRNGVLLRASANAPGNLRLPRGSRADSGGQVRMRGDFREAFQFGGPGECVLVGRIIAGDLRAMRRFGWLLFVAGSGVLAIGLGGAWLLASRAFRPVEAISASASRISAGNLAERIDVTETDSELGRLAGVLNSTFARLEAAFAEQKKFTANASHELRTPLAVIISEAQATLARERTAPEYRETINACLDAAQQMRRLTESLLELARFDAGQEIIERRPFDLAAAARACLELTRPLAEERGLRIEANLEPAAAVGDDERFRQVITNLLSNAIHYNREHGELRVRTWTENRHALLSVANTGPGIAEADLPHIFERFYRADKSRSRAEGRSGLGLAICKAIVDAHGGTLEVSSKAGAGATFTIRLPAV